MGAQSGGIVPGGGGRGGRRLEQYSSKIFLIEQPRGMLKTKTGLKNVPLFAGTVHIQIGHFLISRYASLVLVQLLGSQVRPEIRRVSG